jgi:hypothetical protein
MGAGGGVVSLSAPEVGLPNKLVGMSDLALICGRPLFDVGGIVPLGFGIGDSGVTGAMLESSAEPDDGSQGRWKLRMRSASDPLSDVWLHARDGAMTTAADRLIKTKWTNRGRVMIASLRTN